ncbi:MAG TPA: MFS transporter [Actinophytocola sp.]|uniref:MFS transporter n=1 Tax=Actinophytocola sp. TaxID=1872138 RepID=UPI002DDD003A|nr:MFS transporter [Actinophytocola sp.]HEV2783360.1 MFS transporter [Actinophytocola sp.]
MNPLHRRARIAVMAVFFVTGATFATWASRVPAARDRLALSDGELAIGLLGLSAGAVLGLLAAGAVTVRLGSRAASAVGLVVMCGSLSLITLVPGLAGLAVVLFVLGAGNSVLDVATNVQAAVVERAYGRPIFGGFHAFWSLGGLAGAAIGAAAAGAGVGVAGHFTAIGAAMLLGGLAGCSRYLPDPAGRDGARRRPTAFALPDRALLALGLIGFCAFMAEGTVNDWAALYLTRVAHAGEGTAALAYFGFSIAMVAGRLVADRVVVRTGPARFVRLAAGVSTGGITLGLVLTSPAAGLVGFALLGLGLAGTVPVIFSAACRVRPESTGTAIAAVATLGYLGFLVGPVVIGGLAELLGLRLALAVTVVLTATMGALVPHAGDVEAGRPRSRSGVR